LIEQDISFNKIIKFIILSISHDNSILQEFVDYVVDLNQFDEDYELQYKFLIEFIYAITNSENFSVTLEVLSKWLDIRTDHLKRNLIKNFINNKDYKIELINKKENIYLTRDCLKRLSMTSRAKNSDQVRTYFIIMESMYRQFMLEGIENRVQKEDEEVTERKRKDKGQKGIVFI
jgi:hypothetical protein